MKKDIDIANECSMKPIVEIAEDFGLLQSEVEVYGQYKAKVSLKAFERVKDNPNGKLILVTGMTPTAAGEGKTTTSVGLSQALAKVGKNVSLALREPSLGPIFGIKGGATGGGMSQVVPMEDINLHFTGDLHAVGIAHNLLASLIDNSIHQGNPHDIDPRTILFKRVVDLNDRALRNITIGLGGKADGVPRETGFDITATSELMAIICLADSITDLKKRISNIVVAFNRDGEAITAAHIKAEGSLTMLVRDALMPNLVQTLEHVPTFIHGGPFANIAHGCNSLIATKLGLKLSDYLVTEAGFATELGAEKFFDIKCRIGDLRPSATVIVASLRAIRLHGMSSRDDQQELLETGFENLEKHIENIKWFNVPAVVAINVFPDDKESDLDYVKERCLKLGVEATISSVCVEGGEGGIELAKKVIEAAEQESSVQNVYKRDDTPKEKIEKIAKIMYGADGVNYSPKAISDLKKIEKAGLNHLYVCVAKTQKSISDNPKLSGRPKNFKLEVREVRVSAGAGFIVPISGTIMTMPGLPAVPASDGVDVDSEGNLTGIF